MAVSIASPIFSGAIDFRLGQGVGSQRAQTRQNSLRGGHFALSPQTWVRRGDQGLVTLRMTVSLALTVVPGAGSMATTVQLAGTNTFWYFSVAETRSMSVKPRALSLFSAIFAFSPVRSGIVIGADATGLVVSGELKTDDGVLELHDGVLDWDCVTVTVEVGLDVVPPHAAIVNARPRTCELPLRQFFDSRSRSVLQRAVRTTPIRKTGNADLPTAALHSAVGGQIQDIGRAFRRPNGSPLLAAESGSGTKIAPSTADSTT